MLKKSKQIINLLNNKEITLSVAESCTGGMLAQLITSNSGASKIFKFGIITYSDQSKIKHLKVPAKIIKLYGAVSKECCFFMVNNLSKISNASINIAITGIAGPNGGNKLKPVGLVYIGVKKGKKTEVYKYLFKKMSRDKVRKNSVKKSLDLIKKFI
jgi:nicotinamide-nucleotide amidase|tara:strand:+ start:140 stop:610 length:471 start_codon:yes stop_codon:yes gene_type:complete